MPMNQSFIPTWSAATGIGQPDPEEEDFGDPTAAGKSEEGTSQDPTEDPHGGAEAITADTDEGDGYGTPPAELGKSHSEADYGLLPIYGIET